MKKASMIDFNRKILFLGYGAVAQCTLPILLKRLRVPMAHITIMDFEDRSEALRPYIEQGVTFVRQRLTPDNLDETLSQYVGTSDLLIDLAWNIDCCEIVGWCHERGVLYINTSVELWDPYNETARAHPTRRTLYWRHINLRRMTANWDTPGPTAILEHGANPGLISHFTKQGLLDIAERLLDDRRMTGVDAEQVQDLVADREFNQLAMRLGVKVIHCSERDTQVTSLPKQVDEFVNTWSIEGFREEGTTTAELGWGTHERQLPPLAHVHDVGPRNQICLARMGINTWVRSWVPNYTINGMMIRHGEAFTISDRLTVWDGDRPLYRPTVNYAYCPCDGALASLDELRGYDYRLQPKLRILTDDIVCGSDILGALIMGHAYSAWWTGTILSIEEARQLVPHQNATTMQVAISAVAAVTWMIAHPDCGVCSPEDLPHDYILESARPYLGSVISMPADWTPLKYYENHFAGYARPDLDWDDPWQFRNFLVDGKN